MDTSRVPLALARQRLLTATLPYCQLKDAARGPAGGFVYARKRNKKGEEVGGIVPHVTLKSIANHEGSRLIRKTYRVWSGCSRQNCTCPVF